MISSVGRSSSWAFIPGDASGCRRVLRFAVAATVAFAAVSVAAEAHAQFGPPPAPPPDGADDIPEREGVPKPYAEDLRTTHVYIKAFGSSVVPTGNLAPNRSLQDVLSYGFTVGGALGIGISRDAELNVNGAWGLYSAPTDCETCSGSLGTASIGIIYHLVQGASLDPWFRFGVGYRMTELDHGDAESDRVLAITPGTYHGVDVAQVTLGADFYPVRGFGLGPWFEADAGTMVAWPDGSLSGTRPYGFFMLGLDLVLDPMMWTTSSSSASTTASVPGRVSF
ncbi:MAG: hypothetical protein U0271_33120 [Polyangiaceae bacterium]